MTSTPTPTAAEQPDQSRPSAVGGPGLLAVDGHELELPRTPATDGADGLGVSKLLGSTGVVTLDPGFTNTAVVHLADHLHRWRGRDPALPRLPDRGAGQVLVLPGGRLPPHQR